MRTKRCLPLVICIASLLAVGLEIDQPSVSAAEPKVSSEEELRAGKSLMPTRVYSLEEDRAILQLFQGLRVADVSDGMDRAGLQDVGLVSVGIHPLWRDTQKYTHRFIGIAVTCRYVPTNRAPAGRFPTEMDFDHWMDHWYQQLSPEPFVPLIREGTALVIEENGRADVGTIGSNNILGWVTRGCVGVVTSGGARDTDEITAQRVSLYLKNVTRGVRPGRNEIESVNRPVVIGGVLVRPSDVVVADGDGVIVVPREKAKEVAQYAQATLAKDKQGRRSWYEKLGIPADDSVR